MSAASSTQVSVDPQLQFARHNFDNHQSLIRMADTKAAAYITLLVFLGASTFPLAKDVIPKLRWIMCGGAFTSALYTISYSVFLLSFVSIVYFAHKVISPRGARHYRSPQPDHDLMYYEHVLLHPSQDSYFNAIQSAPPDLLLRNTLDQVFELAHICRAKMNALTNARIPLSIAFCSWLVNVSAGLYVLRWK